MKGLPWLYATLPFCAQASMYPRFVSVIIPVKDRTKEELWPLLEQISGVLANAIGYEIVVLDNGSEKPETAMALSEALAVFKDLQVYSLLTTVEQPELLAAGLENAIGESICFFDPERHGLPSLETLLTTVSSCTDVTLCECPRRRTEGAGMRLLEAGFHRLYRTLYGLNVSRESEYCALLSRRAVTYVLQHSHPYVAWRQLCHGAGRSLSRLSVTRLSSRGLPPFNVAFEPLAVKARRSLMLLVLSGVAPMRLASLSCLVAAALSALYIVYVLGIAAFKSDVAAGWASVSVIAAIMCFLLSSALWIMSEYIAAIAQDLGGKPKYLIGSEATSQAMTQKERLNVEAPPAVEQHA